MLEIPPEFPPVPPHRQPLQTRTALAYADVTPSMILDIPPGFPMDIPPGFTEAHRRLLPAISPAGPACVSTPGTEKKPFVRFSLNVSRPVKMGFSSGFTPLHAVKKEPGLPAASAVVKPGKGDETKIQDNEVHSCLPCFFTKYPVLHFFCLLNSYNIVSFDVKNLLFRTRFSQTLKHFKR